MRWDLTQALREPSYAALLLGPLLIAVLGRWGIPSAVTLFDNSAAVAAHLPFLYAVLLLLPPMLVGMVMGLVLLDDRDAGLLEYFEITPLRRSGYLSYRLVFPAAASTLATLAVALALPQPAVPPLQLAILLLAGACQGPLLVLYLGSFARNKVEGLAYSKAFGLVIVAPLAGQLIASPWRFVLGLVPTFWITEGFLAGTPWKALCYGAISIALSLFVSLLLLRRFNAAAHSGS